MANTRKPRTLPGRLQGSFAFYLLHSGYQVFKQRLRQELGSRTGLELDDYADDETLYPYYQGGESTEYVLASLVKDAQEGQ